MMKQIEDDTNRWKDITCSWTGRINIVKIYILPKIIYRFNAIPVKLLMTFFYRTRTKQFKICMEMQNNPKSQNNLEKNVAGGIMLPEFRL